MGTTELELERLGYFFRQLNKPEEEEEVDGIGVDSTVNDDDGCRQIEPLLLLLLPPGLESEQLLSANLGDLDPPLLEHRSSLSSSLLLRLPGRKGDKLAGRFRVAPTIVVAVATVDLRSGTEARAAGR